MPVKSLILCGSSLDVDQWIESQAFLRLTETDAEPAKSKAEAPAKGPREPKTKPSSRRKRNARGRKRDMKEIVGSVHPKKTLGSVRRRSRLSAGEETFIAQQACGAGLREPCTFRLRPRIYGLMFRRFRHNSTLRIPQDEAC